MAQEKVIIVQIDPTVDVDDDEMYDDLNEVARKELSLSQAGALANPTLLPAGQQRFNAADCFFPNYKLIYRDFTYVISTHCTGSMKFKNTAPYTPGPEKLRADFVFSFAHIEKIEAIGRTFTRNFAEVFDSLQTAAEGFGSTRHSNNPLDTRNVTQQQEASFVEEDPEYQNPTQSIEEAQRTVETQVDQDLSNVRDEDIQDPTPDPETEAREEGAFQDAEERAEEQLNQPDAPRR